MADQAALDAYRAQIKADSRNAVVEILREPEFDLHRTYLALDVKNTVLAILRSDEFRVQALYQNDENIGALITAKANELYKNDENIGAKIAELSAKLDKALAILDNPAV